MAGVDKTLDDEEDACGGIDDCGHKHVASNQITQEPTITCKPWFTRLFVFQNSFKASVSKQVRRVLPVHSRLSTVA